MFFAVSKTLPLTGDVSTILFVGANQTKIPIE